MRLLAGIIPLTLVVPAVCAAQDIALQLGTPISLVTTQEMSSRTNAKGDMVPLQVAADVAAGSTVVIPAGTPAMGQVAESRGTGGMGTTGKLVIRPLYLRLGSSIVRLTGRVGEAGATKADTVLGMVLLTPLLSGRNAKLPAGTAVPAMVERTVAIVPVTAPR